MSRTPLVVASYTSVSAVATKYNRVVGAVVVLVVDAGVAGSRGHVA